MSDRVEEPLRLTSLRCVRYGFQRETRSGCEPAVPRLETQGSRDARESVVRPDRAGLDRSVIDEKPRVEGRENRSALLLRNPTPDLDGAAREPVLREVPYLGAETRSRLAERWRIDPEDRPGTNDGAGRETREEVRGALRNDGFGRAAGAGLDTRGLEPREGAEKLRDGRD